MFSATGRFHARLYLQEQGYDGPDMRNEDRPDVLAWSVLSVWKGGGVLRGIVGPWIGSRDNDDHADLLADGYAVSYRDGTLTFPPLP